MLSGGCLPSGATAITIDDGFYSVYRLAVPTLRRFSLPTSIYVTTYYCLKEHPIFRLVMQYIFWKTRKRELDTTGFPAPFTGVVLLDSSQTKDRIMWDAIILGET